MNKTIIISSIFALFLILARVVFDISWNYLFWSVFILGILWAFISGNFIKEKTFKSSFSEFFILFFIFPICFLPSFFVMLSLFDKGNFIFQIALIIFLVIVLSLGLFFSKGFLKKSYMKKLFFDSLIFSSIFIYSFGISILFNQIHFSSFLFFKEMIGIFLSLLPGVFLVGGIYFSGVFFLLLLKGLLFKKFRQ